VSDGFFVFLLLAAGRGVEADHLPESRSRHDGDHWAVRSGLVHRIDLRGSTIDSLDRPGPCAAMRYNKWKAGSLRTNLRKQPP
jgi:hypothetical protein